VVRHRLRRLRGRTASRSCPGGREALKRDRNGSPCPGCYPTVVVAGPGLRRLVNGPDRARGRRGGRCPGRPGAGKVRSSRTCSVPRVMGSLSAYGVGGHAPAHPGDHAEPQQDRQRQGSMSRSRRSLAPPAAAASLATCSANLKTGGGRWTTCGPPTPRPTPTSRSCTSWPPGNWPTTGAVLGSNAVQLQVTVDPDLKPAGRGGRHRQPDERHRGCRRAVHEHRARPARDHRPVDCGSRSVSVDRDCVDRQRGIAGSGGVSGAAGVAAGIKSSGRARPGVGCERRPERRGGRRVHDQQGQGGARCSGRKQVIKERRPARGSC